MNLLDVGVDPFGLPDSFQFTLPASNNTLRPIVQLKQHFSLRAFSTTMRKCEVVAVLDDWEWVRPRRAVGPKVAGQVMVMNCCAVNDR